MNRSKLDELIDNVYEVVDNLTQNLKPEYDLARHDIRMLKYDFMIAEFISDADRKRLSELERIVREKHKNYCDAIKHAHSAIEQVISAFDGQDIDKKRLDDLQEILNELPACPSESDFLNITDIEDESLSMDDDDDDNEIFILSDSSDDEIGDEEPIDENDAMNSSMLKNIREKSQLLKNIEAELQKLEQLKNQSKTEMFERRDQQLDITKHQQYQRELFDNMNKLKIDYRRTKAQLQDMIRDILSNSNNDSIEREMMELFQRLEQDDVLNKSNENSIPVQEARIPQVSKLPQKSQLPRIPTTQPPDASKLQQLRFGRPSNIPKIANNHPQTPSKIPQTFIKPPQVTFNHSQIPSRIPQFPRTQMEQIPQHVQQQTQIPRIHTRIPQVPASQGHQQIPASRIPRIPQTVQMDTEKHRQTQAMAFSKIPQLGSSRQEEMQNHLRNLRKIIEEQKKELAANLKISESIGNVRKVKARPLNEATSIARKTNVRADEVNRLQLSNLTAPQRKKLNKQNKIKAEDTTNRLLEDIDKDFRKRILKMSLEDREKEEKNDLQYITESMMTRIVTELENENLSHEQKIRALDGRFKILFAERLRIMKLYRGRYFTPNEQANQQFIETIVRHFNENKSFENCREVFDEFFKKIPYEKFKIVKPPPKDAPQNQAKHSSPTSYRRPASSRHASRDATSLPRRPSTVGVSKNIKSKVETQLKNLEESSLEKSTTQTAIKRKLNKFINTFCKLFILNQKNRNKKFKIWVKTFHLNLNPILNDLDSFYKSLPYPELKKFNREQVEQSLDHLLHQVYEQTRKYELTNVKCKDLIGNEMQKLMEQKHLKNLNTSLGIFLQGIKELIEPYVGSETQQDTSSVMQKSQQSFNQRGNQSMLQRVHESNIQRALHRTLMNETDDSVEYPSFNESLLQQVSVPELQTMYKKMIKGKYQIPNVQGTAQQAMMLEKIEKILSKKAERGMAKKRDESFLRAHGRAAQTIEFPIHEKIAPSSINIFKRVIGANAALRSIEVTDEILKALDIILECCEIIDDNIVKVLMNQNRNEISALDESVSNLVAHIKNLVYNNNEIDYADELARLDKLHYKVDANELKSKLGRKKFTKSECENLLENVFLMQVNENEVATYAVVEFIKDLRYLQYKYLLKILKGEIRGYTDKIPTSAMPSRDNLSSESPSVNYLDKIKTVQPIRLVKDYDHSHDLIERDILYVACQLTNQNELETTGDENNDDDRNGYMDYLSRFIIQIAQKFQNGSINERDALRIVGQIFYMLPCIPINFYQRFIYHADNEYFSAIRFNNPSLNTAARISMMAMRDRMMCAEDKLLYGRQINIITNKIERFMFVFDNEIEEIARSFQMLDARNRRRAKISGNELANNGNGILGNPKEIDLKGATDGKIDNVQLSIVSGKAPVTNIANEDILSKLDEIEALLDKHLNEVDHFDNSKVAKMALKYQLLPNAIKRKNYWQCRGTEIPKWFPGFHTVFPNTNQCKPLACSIEQILPHAWRMMAPINYK